MKWLFGTLVFLNLIVFAGMIANKMWKQHAPVATSQQVIQQPPPIIINGYDLVPKKSASEVAVAAASGASNASNANNNNGNNNSKNTNNKNAKNNNNNNNNENNNGNNNNNNNNNSNNNSKKSNQNNNRAIAHNNDDNGGGGQARAKYKECSARVSMPEDDYHRIKGLLARYPHAASRQVVDNGTGESAARMNVVFMQVSDQEASAIQGVVGRYGQLNRSACNR